MFKPSRLAICLSAAFGAAMVSAPSIAQQQPEAAKLERIEITGSRIRQIDAETAQPILKITQADIQKTGLVTVGDIVNQLTSAGTPAFSKGAVLTSNREQGGQYLNLRGLGAQRLLVLVNGKRWSQSVGGFTDLSTIPASMVDRMELLKDGASSIYGSDAIAGVVNFILKKTMDGGQMSLYAGQNELGDGKASDFSLSYGANNDKASLMFAFTYNKVEPVYARSREITKYTFGDNRKEAALGGGPWGRIRPVNAAGTGAAATSTPGYFDLVLNHTGTYDGVGVGQASNNRANYHPFTGAAVDLYNPSQDMMFNSGTEMSSIFTKGSVDITKDIRVVSTAMYADRNSARQIAGYPAQSLAQSSFPVFIDKNSFYNPVGNQGVGVAPGAGVDAFWNRRTIEVPRVTQNNNRTFHIDAAVEGDLEFAGRAFNWSVGINYSQVSGTTLSTGNQNLVNLKKALGPSFRNAAGEVLCGTPTAVIADCVPFDILGGPSASTAKAINYVMHTGTATYGSTVRSVNVDVGGEIVSLPGGMMGFAAGAEQRKVKGFDRPGALEQANLTSDLAGRATEGKYTVDEAYLELNIPLLKNLPLVEALSLNLASRFSDYSNFGETTNSKASLTYRPIKDVLVRGTWAEGFRAPTLGDIAGGGSQSFDTYLDPCDSAFGSAATTPSTAQRCQAAGVAANFRQRNQAGNPVPGAGGGQTPFPFQAGAGNEFLQPETAVTKTVGLVFSPSFLPGFNASLDWYNISIDNRITAVSAGYILGQCYVQGVQPFCGLFTRDASGQINDLRRGNANLGQIETEGMDLSWTYRLPATSIGRFTVRSDSTYVSKYAIKSTATANFVRYEGEWGTPRFKTNLNLDWTMGDFGASFGTRYTAPTKTSCWSVGSATVAPQDCSNPTDGWTSGGVGYNKLDSVYHDLSVSYKTPWKGELRIGANNILDTKPQINYSANGTSSSSSVDPDLPIDRFFYIRYNQKF
jgi:iron complex outermembrane receptor protein